MASIPEIYSLPESQTRDLPRCTDQELISILRNYRSSERYSGLHNDLLRVIDLDRRDDRVNHWFLKPIEACDTVEDLKKMGHGTWCPKQLVSIPNTSQGNSPNYPKFVGTKTTTEFKPTDGSKTVVGMTRYNLLMTMKDRRGLYQDEVLSLCHTYRLQRKATVIRNRNGKRPHAADHCDAVLPPLDELDQDTSKFDVTEFSPLDVDDYGVDVPDLLSTDSSKRPRPESKQWHNFTKIYTTNPEVMYAACNHCDTMLKLKGGSSCGTGSLRHHNDSCRCKPKQEQLPGHSSSMNIPSIALQAITEQLELV